MHKERSFFHSQHPYSFSNPLEILPLQVARPGIMAHKTPSIQSFFQAQSIPSESQLSSSPKPGDGYTAQELHEALRPTVQETWSPPAKYADRDIADLLPGPECISFMGRVVNVFEKRTPPADSASSGSVANRSAARMPRGAKGFIKIIVRDDSGAVTVGCSDLSHRQRLINTTGSNLVLQSMRRTTSRPACRCLGDACLEWREWQYPFDGSHDTDAYLYIS